MFDLEYYFEVENVKEYKGEKTITLLSIFSLFCSINRGCETNDKFCT